MRKQGSCLEKEIMQGTMPGARRRGRPCTAWMDNIKTWTGLSVEESIRMTEDRDKWRRYVDGSSLHRSKWVGGGAPGVFNRRRRTENTRFSTKWWLSPVRQWPDYLTVISPKFHYFYCSCWICNCEWSDVVNNCTYFYWEICSYNNNNNHLTASFPGQPG